MFILDGLLALLTFLFNLATFWKSKGREEARAGREARADRRDEERLAAERRQQAVESLEKLRDNLNHRVEREEDATQRQVLETRLRATEETLTQLYQDMALDDPRVRYYYADNLRALVPPEIGPAAQLPEPVRETAVLAEEAGQAAGATPSDAEGYLLQGNALYLRSEQVEGEAIVQALTDAIEAYDHALEVYTREALPQDWAMTLNNKGNSLQTLGQRLEGEAGAQALTSAIGAYDHATEVYTREALPQQWAMTLNNKGIALQTLGQRLEGEAGVQALTDAIEAYDQALEVRTREALPQYRATTLNNKGNALRILGQRLEGDAGARALTSAIEAYDRALEVYTREALPQDWATTLNNKGNRPRDRWRAAGGRSRRPGPDRCHRGLRPGPGGPYTRGPSPVPGHDPQQQGQRSANPRAEAGGRCRRPGPHVCHRGLRPSPGGPYQPGSSPAMGHDPQQQGQRSPEPRGTAGGRCQRPCPHGCHRGLRSCTGGLHQGPFPLSTYV